MKLNETSIVFLFNTKHATSKYRHIYMKCTSHKVEMLITIELQQNLRLSDWFGFERVV